LEEFFCSTGDAARPLTGLHDRCNDAVELDKANGMRDGPHDFGRSRWLRSLDETLDLLFRSHIPRATGLL
jgi:hypothetical protein